MVPGEIVLFGAVVGVFVVALITIFMIQLRMSQRVDRMTGPVFDYIEHAAHKQANEIIEKAHTEAAALVAAAKAEQQTMLQEHGAAIERYLETLQQEFAKHNQTQTERLNALVEEQIAALEGVGGAALDKLEAAERGLGDELKRAEGSVTELVETTQQAMGTMQQTLDERLQTAVTALQAKLDRYDETVATTLQTETKALVEKADAAVVAYATARKQVVDRHVAQIVEDVAKHVLHKQLTVTEHATVATEALAAAHTKGVL